MIGFEEIARNVSEVKSRIEKEAESHGRPAPELLAATKMNDAEHINFAARACGVTLIGENRVQELLEKYPFLDPSIRIRFIGRLQRNKVKYVVDKVEMIESLDSLPLAYEIEKQASKKGLVMKVLLEVNTGREAQKGGFMPEELEDALRVISELPHVHVCGLMAVTPVCEKSEEKSRYFRETYQKFIDISGKKLHNIDMNVLSMGMTDSYIEAIAEGSTEVRLGSAIFGRRGGTGDAEQKGAALPGDL